jgi:hypothetical protein
MKVRYFDLWKKSHSHSSIERFSGVERITRLYQVALNILQQKSGIELLKQDDFLFPEILSSGTELIKHESWSDELYYLGLLIEMKIAQSWQDKSFYVFILRMIKAIKAKILSFPATLKRKIVAQIEQYYQGTYLGELMKERLKNGLLRQTG